MAQKEDFSTDIYQNIFRETQHWKLSARMNFRISSQMSITADKRMRPKNKNTTMGGTLEKKARRIGAKGKTDC